MLNPYLVAVTIVTENSLIVEYFNKEFCCMTVTLIIITRTAYQEVHIVQHSHGKYVIIYLNQSSERNMIDIPGCSERTNFKYIKPLVHNTTSFTYAV